MKRTAEYIWEFKKRMETRWNAQSQLDDTLLSYSMMKNEVDTAMPEGGKRKAVKGFRSGVGGIVVKRDAALLTVTPPIHVNPPTEDQDDIEFASEVLEPWLAGAWRFSQRGPVWDRGALQLRVLGRAWFKTYHWGSKWSNDNPEYKGLVDGLNKAKTGDEIKDANKALKAFKTDEFPIRMRFVDPRSVWFEPDTPDLLEEVIEIRKMTGSQIRSQGWKLPDDFDERGDHEYDVVEYADWDDCYVVIGSGEPREVYHFEHKMGKSPYSLMEAELLPPNDEGLRWCGGLFYARGMIDTFDEILSDLRENHRDNTRRPIKIYHDPNQEQPENTSGRPTKIPYGPGKTIDLWTTEDVKLGDVTEINEQSIQLLQFTYNLIQLTQIRPVEQGESKSGDSQNKYVTQLQVAERGFDPSMRAINDTAWDICRSFLRCVRAIGEEVYVVPGFKGKGVIALKPEKTRGWEYCIQPRARRAIPIDGNIEAALAQKKLEIGVPPEMVYEEMGYENSQKLIRMQKKSQLADAAFQHVVTPMFLARLQQKANTATPQQLTEMSEMSAGAPDALLQVLGAAGSMPGNERQAMANLQRTGVPQQPQMPQEQVMV